MHTYATVASVIILGQRLFWLPTELTTKYTVCLPYTRVGEAKKIFFVSPTLVLVIICNEPESATSKLTSSNSTILAIGSTKLKIYFLLQWYL